LFGTGVLTLSGANDYTGATTVSSGTLLINGNSSTATGAVAVNGGTLGGTGSTGGSVTVGATATLAPGASIESLGVASVEFLAGSIYAYELNSAALNGDLTYSTGTLDIVSGVGPLGTALTLMELSSGTLAVNDKLTLISYTGGWTSTELFNYLGSTLADDSTFTLGANQWRFNYNDTTGGTNFSGDQAGAVSFVTMTVIPEPRAALLGGLGLLALLRRRRA
jgi:autotransporter-associated beta strand protein